jgi:hypothetical protein
VVIVVALIAAGVLLVGTLVVGAVGYGAYRWLGPTAAWATAVTLGLGAVGMAAYVLQAYASARNADERAVATIFAFSICVPALVALAGAARFVALARRAVP